MAFQEIPSALITLFQLDEGISLHPKELLRSA
jgi:hypothetical protein